MRHFRPERCRRVCCLPVFITATKQSNTFTNMNVYVDVDGLAHQELCSLLSGPYINALVMLQNHHRVRLGLRQASGYPHFSQAWQWTYLVFGFWSREAWISLLPLMKGIGQSVLSVQFVNYGGNFDFGIKGCINNSEQKHHGCVWPRPLHHSCPLHDYKLASSVL